MKIPPIHNMVVQWEETTTVFLNVFTNGKPYYYDIMNSSDTLHYFESFDYFGYYEDILNMEPHLYLPVKASTIDELKLEHPELFV